ncbi:hypothetical protein LTR84_007944 [Exophiala bonariae]|uniref:prephenate dehydratase n=1 Tax=Exophiala bonariae TaxID=1690606 RepID=A0AAV9NLW4_9EURO|nr:hypothetical protein LTR84_007944 [Exophiala bonariae]
MPHEDTLRVAYLGPEASFSHQAAIELFSPEGTNPEEPNSQPEITLQPLPSFTSIFSSVQRTSSSFSTESAPGQPDSQPYDYAVIPIENSTNGSVVQVFDLLGQCGLDDDKNNTDSSTTAQYPDLQVCAEYYLPVHHCLFVHPSQTVDASSSSWSPLPERSPARQYPPISTLYTHPQVWGQCGRFLSKHFPAGVVERIDLGSTSAAASLVAREGAAPSTVSGADTEPPALGATIAAISSRLAGQKHNLTCLAENIEDSPGDNTTRFLVLRNARLRPRHPAFHSALVSRLQLTTTNNHDVENRTTKAHVRHKSLITFTIPHTKPGALADALAVFKTHGFNLTSIDTRPSRRRNWHYVFFVECEEADTEEDNAQGQREAIALDHGGGHDTNDLDANLKSILHGLATYTESLRYLGRFVDQLQTNGEEQ